MVCLLHVTKKIFSVSVFRSLVYKNRVHFRQPKVTVARGASAASPKPPIPSAGVSPRDPSVGRRRVGQGADAWLHSAGQRTGGAAIRFKIRDEHRRMTRS